jgi:transcriptional regulator with XRE-family HTH domain
MKEVITKLFRSEYAYLKDNMNPTRQEALRAEIAKKVHALREKRKFTQTELSKRLGMSQGRYSVIERGDGSFSAEQFVEILKIFNVPVGHFVAEKGNAETSLQNALARLGAPHLAEDARLLPSEQLEDAESVVREALVAGEPARQITALAPVLILNVERLNLTKLWVEFQRYGLERRLAWLIDSTLETIRLELVAPGLSRKQATPLRKAEVALSLFLRREGPRRIQRAPAEGVGPATDWTIDVDVVGPPILSEKTLREIVSGSSAVARRWGVATALQTEDFVEAVRASGVTNRITY